MLFSSFTKETSEAQQGTYLGHMVNSQHRYPSPKAMHKSRCSPHHTYTHAHTLSNTQTLTHKPVEKEGSLSPRGLAGDPGSHSFQPGTCVSHPGPQVTVTCINSRKAHNTFREGPPGSQLPSILGLRALPDCGKLLRVQGVACEGEAPRCWRGEQLLTYYPDTLNPWPHTLQRKQLNQVAPGM